MQQRGVNGGLSSVTQPAQVTAAMSMAVPLLSACASDSGRTDAVSGREVEGPASTYGSDTSYRDVDPCVLLDQEALDTAFGDGVMAAPDGTSTQDGSPACQSHPEGSRQDIVSVVIVQRSGSASTFVQTVQPFVGFTGEEASVVGPWDASLGRCTDRGCILYVLKGDLIIGFNLVGDWVEEEARSIAELAVRKFA